MLCYLHEQQEKRDLTASLFCWWFVDAGLQLAQFFLFLRFAIARATSSDGG